MRNDVKLHITRCQSCSAAFKLPKLHVHYRSTEIGLDNLGKIFVTQKIRHYRSKADLLVKIMQKDCLDGDSTAQKRIRKNLELRRMESDCMNSYPEKQEEFSPSPRSKRARRRPRQEEDPFKKRTQANRLSESSSEAQEGQVFFFPKNK